MWFDEAGQLGGAPDGGMKTSVRTSCLNEWIILPPNEQTVMEEDFLRPVPGAFFFLEFDVWDDEDVDYHRGQPTVLFSYFGDPEMQTHKKVVTKTAGIRLRGAGSLTAEIVYSYEIEKWTGPLPNP